MRCFISFPNPFSLLPMRPQPSAEPLEEAAGRGQAPSPGETGGGPSWPLPAAKGPGLDHPRAPGPRDAAQKRCSIARVPASVRASRVQASRAAAQSPRPPGARVASAGRRETGAREPRRPPPCGSASGWWCRPRWPGPGRSCWSWGLGLSWGAGSRAGRCAWGRRARRRAQGRWRCRSRACGSGRWSWRPRRRCRTGRSRAAWTRSGTSSWSASREESSPGKVLGAAPACTPASALVLASASAWGGPHSPRCDFPGALPGSRASQAVWTPRAPWADPSLSAQLSPQPRLPLPTGSLDGGWVPGLPPLRSLLLRPLSHKHGTRFGPRSPSPSASSLRGSPGCQVPRRSWVRSSTLSWLFLCSHFLAPIH